VDQQTANVAALEEERARSRQYTHAFPPCTAAVSHDAPQRTRSAKIAAARLS